MKNQKQGFSETFKWSRNSCLHLFFFKKFFLTSLITLNLSNSIDCTRKGIENSALMRTSVKFYHYRNLHVMIENCALNFQKPDYTFLILSEWFPGIHGYCYTRDLSKFCQEFIEKEERHKRINYILVKPSDIPLLCVKMTSFFLELSVFVMRCNYVIL